MPEHGAGDDSDKNQYYDKNDVLLHV
jgi:hypothetical protein